MKDNLYDRISTRPFLNALEKKWIVFQLLCSLVQCHQNDIFHGDIKTENIMVTSWTSVLLTDFASFKPTFLQKNNPADFSYFFDTSRRRTCYLAPERFIDTKTAEVINTASTELPDSMDLGLMKDHVSELTSKMDIFSLGCVITELFSEGIPLFDLSKLLAYRSNDYDPLLSLEKIDDVHVKELISEMISKDPEKRGEAFEYLERYRGSLFPEEFFTFLRAFMVRFASVPVLTPDEKVVRIADCISVILKELAGKKENLIKENGTLVLIISLITSSVRNCHHCHSKLKCLELLLQLAENSNDELIIERVVPYVLYLIGDSAARVRARAIWTLTQILQLVEILPPDEGNIFPEYILPALMNLPDDEEVIVRIAYAENIASIAEIALNFLEMAQLRYNNTVSEEEGQEQTSRYQGSYDAELQQLHEVIQTKVVKLLSDSENIVKQTLLEKGITRLCVFFGRQKANDVLLSHMITFLNDKKDWHLRASFFDSIVGVASYVGWQSLAMLKPLLQQGLTDNEEFVICKSLNALTYLGELGLLQKSTLYDFTSDIIVFLSHPNIWIRYGAVGFVTAVAKTLSAVDVHCKFLPLLQPYFKEKIVHADQDVLLISVLKEPLSRSVFDFIVRSENVKAFYDCLHERQVLRRQNKAHVKVEYPKIENDVLSHMFRKLIAQGMNDEQEDTLILLKTVILKLHNSKINFITLSDKGVNKKVTRHPGVIDLKQFGTKVERQHADLLVKSEQKQDVVATTSKSVKKSKREYQSPMNAEWNQIFGNMNEKGNSRNLPMADVVNEKKPLTRSASMPQTTKTKQRTYSIRAMDDVTISPVSPTSSCSSKAETFKKSLYDLVKYKREQYSEELETRLLINEALYSNNKGQIRRPKGNLIIHLHEHKSAVTKLQVCPNTSLFASISNDGTMKLWDTQRVEKHGMIVKSCFTFQLQHADTTTRGKVRGIVFLQKEQHLACASDKGDVYIINPEVTPTPTQMTQCPMYKPVVKLSTRLDTAQGGDLVDMHHFYTASHSVLSYATVRGLIYGWDVRVSSTIWKLQNDPAFGLITSFFVHPSQCWLTVGTSHGEIICWDLRFQLPVARVTHPRGARVRRLSAAPLLNSKPSCVTCSFDGNNEVSMWNLETGACEKALWASNAPPLSQTQVSQHSVYGIYTSNPDIGQFILTGGSDRRIRLWDLQSPNESCLIAGSSSDNLNDVVLRYSSRLIDGTKVLREMYCKSSQVVVQDDMPKRAPDKPPTGHHDCITDLAFVTTPQHLLVSASRDGVIKIWK
ncbi:phosphoinositide 3-kinase regulatory subunit 4-like isoform X2 [Xenia sp. Carnegie-2017]|nr:phosphoinositide 3-kinase regulatory subunit 4-like isoform X2 [Xenia sp. Carnegie-2017]